LIVIASEAKQSILWLARKLDCFGRFAPLRKRFAFVAGNDGNFIRQLVTLALLTSVGFSW
jgi:hypothetical protein